MHMIDGPRTVPALPAARAAGTPGYFGPGVPASGQKATAVTYEFMNAVMMELITPILQAGMTLDRNDHTQLYQAIVQIASDIAGAEVGKVEYFVCKSPPARYLKCNGHTIGSAESGATARANADTLALYRILWADWENYLLPIQDSAGGPATRGASADADFAAGKRLALPEIRGEHIRVWDDGRGVDPDRVFGSAQDAMVGPHTHPLQVVSSIDDDGQEDRTLSVRTDNLGGGAKPIITMAADNRAALNAGTENRVRNIALSAFIRFK